MISQKGSHQNTIGSRLKILVSTDISEFGFYGYIVDISIDIFT